PGAFVCARQIWDARSGGRLGPPLRHRGWVDNVEFSPDGNRVLTSADSQQRADPAICEPSPTSAPADAAQIWDVATGQPIGKSMWHGSGVRTAHFSPDGKRGVTAATEALPTPSYTSPTHPTPHPTNHQH